MAIKGRLTGFYWVKFEGNWVIGYYFNFAHYWQLCGNPEKCFERDFEAINETPLLPPTL